MERSLFIFFYSIILFTPAQAQPSLAWAKREGGIHSEGIKFISSDSLGNLYTVGAFSDVSTQVGNVTLYNSNGSNYIAAYSAVGSFQWVMQLKNMNISTLQARGQHVYFCGWFSDTAYIGTTILASSGDFDGFAARIQTSGNIEMLLFATGIGNELIRGIDADKYGNIYLTGQYDTLTFLNSDTLSGISSCNYFIAKYNTTGALLWKETGTQKANDITGRSISVLPDGSGVCSMAYVSLANVSSTDTVHFSGSTIYYQNNTPGVNLVMNYDSTGNLSAIKDFYMGNHGSINGVKYENPGNIYLVGCGDYSGPVIWNLNNSLNIMWSKHYTAWYESWVAGFDVDVQGNLFITGSFSNFMEFPADTLKNAQGYTSYLAKIDGNGNFVWAFKAGKMLQSNGNSGEGVSCDAAGNIYLAGTFSDSLYLTPGNNFSASGPEDIYLVKFGNAWVSGIGPVDLENPELLLFPNPTSSIITLKKGQQCRITGLFDSKGNLIQKCNAEQIDLSDKPKGIYIIEITTEDQKVMQRVVLEK